MGFNSGFKGLKSSHNLFQVLVFRQKTENQKNACEPSCSHGVDSEHIFRT